MLNRNKIWTLPAVFGAALLIATAVPQLKASGFNDNMTKVTFSGPVEIGGAVLPAGTYVFKTLHGNVDSNLIEVMDANNQYLIRMLNTVPVVTPQDMGDARIDLSEQPAGTPERVKDFLYPGRYSSWEFQAPRKH